MRHGRCGVGGVLGPRARRAGRRPRVTRSGPAPITDDADSAKGGRGELGARVTAAAVQRRASMRQRNIDIRADPVTHATLRAGLDRSTLIEVVCFKSAFRLQRATVIEHVICLVVLVHLSVGLLADRIILF